MSRSMRFVLLLWVSVAASGCITLEIPLFGGGEWVEQVIYGKGDAKILMLELGGTLSTRGEAGRFGIGGRESIVARVREQLERAVHDDEIKALLLRIDSPGGTVIASEILYREILRFKKEKDVPVVAQFMGVAASGGYYVAMAADEVRAYPSAITGSIGVIMAGVNVAGLLDKVGVANQSLTTGAFKDAGSPLRPMRPEESAQLQTILEDLFETFLDVVETGRPELDRPAIEKLADGRIYSAKQAQEAGLVDALGDLPEAVAATLERASLDEARLVIYHRGNEARENLFSGEAQSPAPGGLLELVQGAGRPAFLYMWAPW